MKFPAPPRPTCHNVAHVAGSSIKARYPAAAEELDARNFEFQLLYGMGEPLAGPLVKMGVSTRLYIPYGELVPGMGYLVRRILENSANESFLRTGFKRTSSWGDAKPNRPSKRRLLN